MARTILITGCSSGIGLATARHLHRKGWRVFATARDDAALDRLRDEGMEPVRLDLTDPASIAAAADTVLATTDGVLDALFNNAAHAIPGAVEDVPPDALRAIFEANLFGLHDLTIRILPAMRAQGRGRILNCSSVLGFAALPWRGAYNASKFALEGLTDTLRLEMRDTGIHVVLIQPGPITSRIRANAIPHFECWIDWQASPRRAAYEATLLKRLYEPSGGDAFELPAHAVALKVEAALTARRPATRYKVTTPTYVAAVLRRLAPRGLVDRVLAKG
ncbi:MAG: SDR family NAD(P)-dependent oxidoreductase [Shimia sp.]